MKPIPHSHPGEVELCYDAFCARITTSERAAAIIGCGFLGAVLGSVFGTEKEDVVAGRSLGGPFGALSSVHGRDPRGGCWRRAGAPRVLPQRGPHAAVTLPTLAMWVGCATEI